MHCFTAVVVDFVSFCEWAVYTCEVGGLCAVSIPLTNLLYPVIGRGYSGTQQISALSMIATKFYCSLQYNAGNMIGIVKLTLVQLYLLWYC